MPALPIDRVAVYVFRRAPRVQLLQLRRAVADDAHPRTWQPVYGSVEAGESAVTAALRELREETGLRPLSFFQVEFLESCYFRPRDCILMMPVFGAEVASDAPIALDSEHDAHRWVSREAVTSAFMWRSQREAVAALLEQLDHPGPAHDALRIPLSEGARPTAHGRTTRQDHTDAEENRGRPHFEAETDTGERQPHHDTNPDRGPAGPRDAGAP